MKLTVKKFTFNPFQENTYIVYGPNLDAVIIDPGCSNVQEQRALSEFVSSKGLSIKALLNTHCHIDHVYGNDFVLRSYKVDFYMHENELPVLKAAERSAQVYGLKDFVPSPPPSHFLKDNDELIFGDVRFKVIFGPGHAPGHVAFYVEEDQFIISGDILFKGSFGRVDLPGGSIDILKHTLTKRIFTLANETIVYSGHGPETTIESEKYTNPILHYD